MLTLRTSSQCSLCLVMAIQIAATVRERILGLRLPSSMESRSSSDPDFEFVGAITYRARGRSKVVQFWRMQAEASPSRDLMEDIMAVEWLPLSTAVRKLSYPLERLFLSNVGRNILRARRKTRSPRRKSKLRHGLSKGRRHSASSRGRKSARASGRRARATILQRVLGLSK